VTVQKKTKSEPFDPEKTDTLDRTLCCPPASGRKSGFPFLRVVSWAFILAGLAVLLYAVAMK